jgi:hypothetical protein
VNLTAACGNPVFGFQLAYSLNYDLELFIGNLLFMVLSILAFNILFFFLL